jgi:hypothetical protein
MEEFRFYLSALEAEVKKGKNYSLIEPVLDSGMKLLIGTRKILTDKDVIKLKEIYKDDPYKTIPVRTAIPHYIDEDKRIQWSDYIISFFKKSIFMKKITREKLDFIVKYINSTIRESDYLVWKLSQLKNFSAKLFENSLHTCFISLLTYYNYTLSVNSGMIDGTVVEKIIHAALLHNLGFMKYDPKIHEKKRIEINQKKDNLLQHPVEAYKLIKSDTGRHDLPEEVLQAILNHEEFTDGSGYPRGLVKDELPFLAKLLSISNYAVLLITGEWSLKERENREYYLKLKQDRNKFDPELFEALDDVFKALF